MTGGSGEADDQLLGPHPSNGNGHAHGNGNGNGSRNGTGRRCQFGVSPPRHFLYPAVLLLLAEEPRHGYRLVDPLIGMGFGPVDRPSVYRALADLESDGLLTSWNAAPSAGSVRHVYAVTDAGRLKLRAWMAAVAEQTRRMERLVDRAEQL